MPALEWMGKDKVINHHQKVPYQVLERQYSFDENGQHDENNGSENKIIHGDNLLALKALLPEYEGKIKCIYIDPPYNVAKSTNVNKAWVYSDNVDDPKIQKWLNQVVGDEGEDLTRHDKWLCMMYPRLKLLHKLLASNGILFISIDDNELYSLKMICDEIFGTNHFIKNFVWHTTGHTDNQDVITGVHEYILCYAKNSEQVAYNKIVDPNILMDSKITRNFAENSITKNGPKNPPSYITLPIGFPCEIDELFIRKSENRNAFISAVNSKGYITRELTKMYDMKYPVKCGDIIVKKGKITQECQVFSGWMNSGKLQKFIENKCKPIDDDDTQLKFYLSRNGVIYYYRANRQSHYIQTVLKNMGTTETNKYLIEHMGIHFDYPKPVELVSYLISFASMPGDIILDSFAGSGTTGHAVLDLNRNDTDRKFILIEMSDYAENVTAERIRKTISGYEDDRVKVTGTGGSFSYYELGETLLLPNGSLNENIDIQKIFAYIWFTETKKALSQHKPIDNPYLLGVDNDTAYYCYYEKEIVTTLDRMFLATIRTNVNSYIIYADLCTLSDKELQKHNIVFKKIPRDIAKL